MPIFDQIYLREWRKAKGLTLTQLGHLAGVDHGNLSKLERGIFPYSQAVLEKLADALGVSPAMLLSFSPAEAEEIEEEIPKSHVGAMPTLKDGWRKFVNNTKMR